MRKKSIITGIRYLCGGKLSTRLYDKRDDFDFHIANSLYCDVAIAK